MKSVLLEFEAKLVQVDSSDVVSAVVETISRLCVEPASPGSSIEDILDCAGEKATGSRDAALFLLRALSIPAFVRLGDNQSLQMQRRIVRAVELHLPDICQTLKLNDHKQNSEKFLRLATVFTETIEKLDSISRIGATANAITTDITGLFRLLSQSLVKAVLAPYDFVELSAGIKEVLNGVRDVLESDSDSFSVQYRHVGETIRRYAGSYGAGSDPVSAEIARPFFLAAGKAIRELGEESTEKFACNVRLWKRPGSSNVAVVERRYPLHDPERVVHIKIPLANDGPGSAVDVRAEIACADDRVLLEPSQQELGTIRPGNFPLYLEVAIGEPLDHLDLMVEVSWRSPIATKRDSHAFECRIVAQDSAVDWELLEQIEPYSTAVAEGTAFVGRTQKLRAVASRLEKRPMQSSLITGQKRVGKTSLALAVSDRLRSDPNYSIIYLEYGDYAQPTAEATIEFLCRRLFGEMEAIGAEATEDLRKAPKTSLAVLNQLAQGLARSTPARRIVVILDEFDELHPEMYRYGAVAETFFSNLRTLSAKQNVSFVLVGGENMPFIVAAQGDQLNKFVAEELDYFSRADEWEDYEKLVKKEGVPLQWHASAIERVFYYTHGHPYYTNLLCAQILRDAATARDTDITDDEVDVAVSQLSARLATNVFAHFWKDGISGDRDQAEVAALKRCKFLVAAGKLLRQDVGITVEHIASHSSELLLEAVDIAPLMNDFLRRGIIVERGSDRTFSIPLFGEWLKANGVRLIADTLGSELEAAIKSAEELAYVTSMELVDLVKSWPLYKGRKIDAEMVRAWLSQAGPNTAQRILFKILKVLEFVSEEQVREMLRQVHSQVKFVTSVYSTPTRTQRRYDLLVTYVDGPGKSGATYASKYAEENLISSQCVIERGNFSASAIEVEKKATINGVVIVDDVAGTGRSLSENLARFVDKNKEFLTTRDVPIVVAVMYSTKEAELRIRETIRTIGYSKIDLRICRQLTSKHCALERSDIWNDEAERSQARQLVESAGRQIYRDNPLGYGGLGLNIVFFDTCPNNSLPILHSSGKNWMPLFQRIAN